jgi:hypothetical protein
MAHSLGFRFPDRSLRNVSNVQNSDGGRGLVFEDGEQDAITMFAGAVEELANLLAKKGAFSGSGRGWCTGQS